MRLNKKLFYIHRFISCFFLLILIAAIILILFYVGRVEDPGFLFIFFSLYIGMGILHFKASNDVSKGSQSGKRLSQVLGVILLIGFPIGTILGIVILFLTRNKHWEWNKEIKGEIYKY